MLAQTRAQDDTGGEPPGLQEASSPGIITQRQQIRPRKTKKLGRGRGPGNQGAERTEATDTQRQLHRSADRVNEDVNNQVNVGQGRHEERGQQQVALAGNHNGQSGNASQATLGRCDKMADTGQSQRPMDCNGSRPAQHGRYGPSNMEIVSRDTTIPVNEANKRDSSYGDTINEHCDDITGNSISRGRAPLAREGVTARTPMGKDEWPEQYTGRPAPSTVNIGAPGNEVTRRPSHVRHLDRRGWPSPALNLPVETAHIYEAVMATGVHNHECARIQIETSLNIQAWKDESTGHQNDDMVLKGIQYGFPLQYDGPPMTGAVIQENHSSATAHNDSIEAYI